MDVWVQLWTFSNNNRCLVHLWTFGNTCFILQKRKIDTVSCVKDSHHWVSYPLAWEAHWHSPPLSHRTEGQTYRWVVVLPLGYCSYTFIGHHTLECVCKSLGSRFGIIIRICRHRVSYPRARVSHSFQLDRVLLYRYQFNSGLSGLYRKLAATDTQSGFKEWPFNAERLIAIIH